MLCVSDHAWKSRCCESLCLSCHTVTVHFNQQPDDLIKRLTCEMITVMHPATSSLCAFIHVSFSSMCLFALCCHSDGCQEWCLSKESDTISFQRLQFLEPLAKWLTCWCKGMGVGLAMKGHRFDCQFGFCCIMTLGSCSCLFAHVGRQYNMLPVNEWRCSVAGKVTIGLASH